MPCTSICSGKDALSHRRMKTGLRLSLSAAPSFQKLRFLESAPISKKNHPAKLRVVKHLGNVQFGANFQLAHRKSKIWRPNFRILDFGFWILNLRFWISDFEFWISDFAIFAKVWISHKNLYTLLCSGWRIFWALPALFPRKYERSWKALNIGFIGFTTPSLTVALCFFLVCRSSINLVKKESGEVTWLQAEHHCTTRQHVRSLCIWDIYVLFFYDILWYIDVLYIQRGSERNIASRATIMQSYQHELDSVHIDFGGPMSHNSWFLRLKVSSPIFETATINGNSTVVQSR